MVRLIIQNIWADRGKMQYLVIYYFIYSNIILQLSKPGSFIERLQYHWDFFILFFKYIFLLYIIVIIISQLYRSDTINETKPLILTSYTGRIIYAVLGSVGLLLGIAELIWFYVPYKNPLYIKAIGLFFNAGYWGWIVAVFDQTTKKAKWSMLIRSNAIENETTTYAKKEYIEIIDNNSKNAKRRKIINNIFIIFLIIFSSALIYADLFVLKEPYIALLVIAVSSFVIIAYILNKGCNIR